MSLGEPSTYKVNDMADAMLALPLNRRRADAMGRAGRARVEPHFTLDRTAARLREIMGLQVS